MYKTRQSYYIAVDFDGTMSTHNFPGVGIPLPLAVETVKELQELGHKIILFTARGSDENVYDKNYLQDAIDWLADNGITPWAVNDNPEQKRWSNSGKVYANYYIDDTAIGTHINEYGCVDWVVVRKELKKRGVL